MTRYPEIDELLGYHREVMAVEGQQSLLLDRGKLESALARPAASAFGEDAFPTLAQKAAALLQGVAIAHAFLDGNKRIALGAMLTLLRLNGVRHEVDHDALVDLTLAVAAGEMREVEEIAARIAELFGIE